ncbi:MAG: TIGR03621 family F420-dependent LLM class oxidoreductase [Acidimicrobiia bacterium]
MPEVQPIRFSIQLPGAPDLRSWSDKVRRADDLGFHSVSIPDHLGPSLPQLAPLVALASAAAVTTSLRLAITVLDNDFRHPVMLAKEIATLDLLSDGRVDMGLGAGWLEEDYTKTGVATWDPPATRVSRLFESVAVLRLLFSGESVTFAGEFYEIDDFRSNPLPVQSPVPLMIGAREKRMLGFAAREAQIVSVLAATGEGGNRLEGFERQLGWIADARGDRTDLVVGLRVPAGELAAPGESARSVAARFGGRVGLTADEVLDSPFVLVGDLARIKDHLVEIRERFGVTYLTLSEELAFQIAPVIEEIGR